MNAARRGHFKRLLREQLGLKSGKYIDKEMFPTAIKKDIERAEKVIEVIGVLFVIPWENDELVSLPTGIIAHPRLIDDLVHARDKGMAKCMEFISSRCSVEKDVIGTLNKTSLMTFSNLKKVVNTKTN